QRLTSQFARLAYNWTVTPHMLSRTSLYFNRFVNDNAVAHRDVDGAASLGLDGLASQGFPDVNWGQGPFVTLAAPGSSYVQYTATNTMGVQHTVNLSRGRHFVKTGIDFRVTQTNDRGFARPGLNFHPRATAIPNETFSGNLTGYSFASYLLGVVDSASLIDPVGLGHQTTYSALFVQDDFKVSSRLTLQLGLRWDYVSPIREAADRLSSWSPGTIDPVSGLPGAFDFAGSCAGCTGRRYFGRRDLNNFAPRIGFAFRLIDAITLRGAYGIFFEAASLHRSQLGKAGYVAWGGTYVLDPDPVEPWRGIFHWDDGFPATERYRPASYDRSWGNRSRPAMFDPSYGMSPYIQRWNFNIQSELAGGLVLDVGYLAAKGTGLRSGQLKPLNQLPTEALAEHGRNLNEAIRNQQDAARNGVRYPFPGFQGTVASALRDHPQVAGNRTVKVVGAPLGFSTTHSLQAVLNRQFHNGLTAYVNYTWSKTLTNVESSVEGQDKFRPQDCHNLGLEKSVAPYDVPHMFKAYVDYELPLGRGRRYWGGAGGLKNALLGGWSVSAILNYFSGQPLGFRGSSPLTGGWNGAGRRVNIAPGPLKTAGFGKSQFEL
ncbi:MAG: TonB-dependent receptor, partial [bacterium]|nr:TonB-dependent receptor [bacterium]